MSVGGCSSPRHSRATDAPVVPAIRRTTTIPLIPAYIARLAVDDPLFTADFLDNPLLLRKLGLVTVHADGFDRPGLQRAVPTLLGLARSLTPDFGAVGDRVHALGWSGDGVPVGGSLRDFATGAVREHLARSPARVEGVDFRRPTAQELRAIEAFMLSLGRGAEDELELGDFIGVTFRSTLVEEGRKLFNHEASGSCALCHRNGTALNEGGFNGMFEIGVQRRRNTPAQRLDPNLAGDGGFGPCPPGAPSPKSGCGDGRFNAPSLIEAADTTPSFHDNSAATIEDAVRFYTTRAFAQSTEGQTLNIRLTSADVVAIAALLRTLNAIDNIRSSNSFARLALGRPPGRRVRCFGSPLPTRVMRSRISPAARASSMPPRSPCSGELAVLERASLVVPFTRDA